MKVVSKIAFRYLFSRKSNDVITWISRIALVGIAIGSAALIVVSSVFNGFVELIEQNIDSTAPYYKIVNKDSDIFSISDAELDSLSFIPGISAVQGVIEGVCVARHNATQQQTSNEESARHESKQALLKLKGMEGASGYVLSEDGARELAYKRGFLSQIELFYPSDLGVFNSTLNSIKGRPVAISSAMTMSVIVPISQARQLLSLHEEEYSGVEIYCDMVGNAPTKSELQKGLAHKNLKVLDRVEQNPSLHKVMRYEKLAIYMILLMILLLISVNIYSSLSMLIIEKQADIANLKAMGATNALVKRIFFTQGMMVSSLGLVVGVIVGLMLSYAQQYFGIVNFPGNSIVDYYPVKIKLMDVLLCIIAVTGMGASISKISIKNI